MAMWHAAPLIMLSSFPPSTKISCCQKNCFCKYQNMNLLFREVLLEIGDALITNGQSCEDNSIALLTFAQFDLEFSHFCILYGLMLSQFAYMFVLFFNSFVLF
jgi:hypothetical protein